MCIFTHTFIYTQVPPIYYKDFRARLAECYTYMHIYVYIYIYIYMYVYIHAHIYICTNMYTHTCIHIYIYTGTADLLQGFARASRGERHRSKGGPRYHRESQVCV